MSETKYGKYIATKILEKSSDDTPGASRVFLKSEGSEHPDGVGLSIIGGYRTEPYFMVKDSMVHDFDQCLLIIGANPNDMNDFDAEIELCLGEEREKHMITQPSVVHIPAGLVHCPFNFIKVNKPVLFMDISITGKYAKTTLVEPEKPE